MGTRLPDARTDYRDVSYLYQVIEAIGAGPDLASILRRIVSLVTEATRCHACFIYFVNDDQLTLRAASKVYAHLEGKVTFPVGNGLTGWVAKTRQSAVMVSSRAPTLANSDNSLARRAPGSGPLN